MDGLPALLRNCTLLLLTTAAAIPAQRGSSGGSSGTGKPTAPPRVSNTQPAYPRDNTVSPYNFPAATSAPVDPVLMRMMMQERQKRVTRDTERLIHLTQQYQAEVKSEAPKEQTDKHLKEIEKLAREVRTTLTQ